MHDTSTSSGPSIAIEGVRGVLVFVIVAPFTAAVVAAGASGALSLGGQAAEAPERLFLFAPVLVFAGALAPAALAGLATGAGAVWTGRGLGLYMLAALAGALATCAVHGARFQFDPAAVGTLAGFAIPPSLAAVWFGAQLGLIARRDER